MDAAVNLELGRRAELGGDYLRAEQYYRRVEALEPTPLGRRRIAHRIVAVLVRAERYQEARERCQSLLDEDPRDRPARFLLAALYAAWGRPRDAERELDVLQRSDPDDPAVYLELGRLYRDGLGDPRRAALAFERYLVLAPSGAEAARVRFDLERQRIEEGAAAASSPALPATRRPRTPGGRR